MSTDAVAPGRFPGARRAGVLVAALCCGAGAALTAVGLAAHAELLVLLPAVICAGVIVTAIALTRFGAFVLVMLLVRASVDATKLTSNDTTARLLTPSTLVAVLFIVAAALWLVVRYRRHGLPGSGLRTALVVLLCTAVISIPNSMDPVRSAGDVLRLLAIVLMYVVLEQLMADPRMMRRALVAVFCSAIFPVIYTAGGAAFGHAPVEVKGTATRVVGTFVQSNTFGAYLMLLVIVGVAVWPHVHGRMRVGLTVLLAACGVCLVLTYTLAAILGAFVGLAVVGIKQSKRLLLALAAALLLVLAAAPTLASRLAEVTDTSTYAGTTHAGNSLAWRLEYWSEIAPLANENPVTGIGYGMTSYLTQQGKQPHNDYLRAYVETGVLGLVAYLVFIVLLVRTGLRAARAAPPGTLDRSVAVGYLGCATAMALASIGSNQINGVAQLWYFVAFAAAASSVLRRANRPERLPAASRSSS